VEIALDYQYRNVILHQCNSILPASNPKSAVNSETHSACASQPTPPPSHHRNAPACARLFAVMTSFGGTKRKDTCRPSGYRTPSPPRYAVEPLSPASEGASAFWPSHNGNWVSTAEDGLKERHITDETESEDEDEVVGVPTMAEPRTSSDTQSHNRSSSTMDAFATIALASSPTFSKSLAHMSSFGTFSTPARWQHHRDHTSERPSKRARSEKLASPDWHRTDQRPATSHAKTTDMESDAELLLFLARQPIRSSVTTLSTTEYAEQQSQGPHEAGQSVIAPHESQEDHTSEELLSLNESHANVANIETGDQQVDTEHQHLPAYESVVARRSESPVLPDHYRSEEDQLNTIVDLVDETMIGKDDGVDASTEPGKTSLPGTATDEHEEPGSPQVESSVLTDMNTGSLSHGPSVTGVSDPHQKDPGMDVPYGAPEPPPAALSTKAPNSQNGAHAICGICHFARNSLAADIDSDATSWISCDGCKRWFHFACAGFKSEREVRSVDKYSCRECKPTHGPTTFVRKSSRAHTAIDYAGLNEGVVKTSDENPEHHYIRPIKEGTIKFLPDNFARMRPELVTAEFFEKGDGMKEPVVIPAWMNPRPPDPDPSSTSAADTEAADVAQDDLPIFSGNVVDDWFSRDYKYQYVPDDGQDALDMVIPKNLTVRRVGELYGPEEKVEVIDVKSQEGEDKKWNMRRWVDYYESKGAKKVRNVISLEVSQSKLGRLIRRPRIVRELDLQDSVWPADLQAKGDFPKVQFYCLMSVADCYTDFHIDFGGSSVFYHILKGKKTFLFIPPREKHLKKYEEWCMSQAQNWTFLADQTKECYRVDLSEGDTMLIPSGWIHAVWTPENSLVIGGNFLTRMHYGMQIRIAQIEKATKVARKFRYPHFQKLLWYTAIRYLERDPIPASVVKSFHDGHKFFREIPSYYEFDQCARKAKTGDEDYHARYYSQYELEGLPDLARYLLRTALISMGKIADGITADTRNAVKRSIPKGHGDPLDIVKKFAMWSAWKRGNEFIPHWAHPDAVPGDGVTEPTDKKPSAAALRRLEREAAISAYRIAPERQSARKLSQLGRVSLDTAKSPANDGGFNAESPATDPSTQLSLQTPPTSLTNGSPSAQRRRSKYGVKGSVLGPKRVACDKCRKRRIRCKHKDEVDDTLATSAPSVPDILRVTPVRHEDGSIVIQDQHLAKSDGQTSPVLRAPKPNPDKIDLDVSSRSTEGSVLEGGGRPAPGSVRILQMVRIDDGPAPVQISRRGADPPMAVPTTENAVHDVLLPIDSSKTASEGLVTRRIRSRACDECRKSKVRRASTPLIKVFY